jgi:hypothetical protein
MTESQTLARIAEAFELMWGNFPDPTLLVQRDRTILAVNDAAARQGMEPGRKCFSYNPDPRDVENGACKGCQADQALDMGTAITCSCRLAGKRSDGYWIPLKGSREVYVHGVSPRNPALPVIA